LTRRIVKSLDEAIVYINAHPKEAKKFLRKYLSEAYWAQIDLYPDPLYLTSADSRDEIYIGIATQYRRIGIIAQDIDLAGATYHGDRLSQAN
jgi:ABC-type nitrate/sulfonate/bicarbonate transport system substrate-binding protein